MPYMEDYGRDGYAGRRSQVEEEEEEWVPESYLEKGWRSERTILRWFCFVVLMYFS